MSRTHILGALLVGSLSTTAYAQGAPEPAPVPPPPPDKQPDPAMPAPVVAGEPKKEEKKDDAKKDEPKWYDKLAVRGYLQLRERLYLSDDGFKNDLGDRAIAKNNTFSLRRARLVIAGDVAPWLSLYGQIDAAGAAVTMRDWYGDIYVDCNKEFRLRVGQSKVPFGYETPQSSQNRAPLDRFDATNSGTPGERDIGVFAYWTPTKVHKLFKKLGDAMNKGTGDYGLVAVGAYSGQTLNVADKNENIHVVGRVAYPFELGGQILEVGAGGYVGKFNVTKEKDLTTNNNYRDARAVVHVALYPKPIGFQAEYNVGKGPVLDTATTEIKVDTLHGGYAMVIGHVGDFFPFVRGGYYKGGLKSATDAPLLKVKELAIGSEWQWKKWLELTAEVDIANRQVNGVGACTDGMMDPSCVAAVFRVQAQVNY